jgi:pyridoxamine 5'-phosphate oxidase
MRLPDDRRREYESPPLRRADLHPDAIEQFREWFRGATESGAVDADAMTLATADAAGRPSARTVLLKQFDAGGFVFFTNLRSRKARDLERNPWAALTFYWSESNRQVRIEGRASKVARELSERYFRTRPRGSRLSAYVSRQSEEVSGREELERKIAEAERAFPEGEIPTPEDWGGYRIEPASLEFWQGRRDRLHDRFLYLRREDGAWSLRRLAP